MIYPEFFPEDRLEEKAELKVFEQLKKETKDWLSEIEFIKIEQNFLNELLINEGSETESEETQNEEDSEEIITKVEGTEITNFSFLKIFF